MEYLVIRTGNAISSISLNLIVYFCQRRNSVIHRPEIDLIENDFK